MKKNLLKRFVSVALAATLIAASLTGCGKSGEKTSSETGSGGTEEAAFDKPDTWIADRTITVQASM
ncbi:MAG: hypothetical protein WCD89_26605 [Anaerocolumna sp.]